MAEGSTVHCGRRQQKQQQRREASLFLSHIFYPVYEDEGGTKPISGLIQQSPIPYPSTLNPHTALEISHILQTRLTPKTKQKTPMTT